MIPAEQARVDQLRAEIAEALSKPCDCGNCLSDETLLALQERTDEELLVMLHQIDA